MIRVLIWATSPIVRAGLARLLRGYASLEVIAGSGEESGAGPGAIATMHPDVVLAEWERHEDETASAVYAAAAVGVPVVLLVPGPGMDWADGVRHGVKAVLPSNVTGPQIAAAIEAAAVGLVVLHPSEVKRMQPPGLSDAPDLPEPLTTREIEVLRLLAEGLGNKEIASRLGISEHTAKFHVASIMGKLGAASRTEAVTLGIRRGLVLI